MAPLAGTFPSSVFLEVIKPLKYWQRVVHVFDWIRFFLKLQFHFRFFVLGLDKISWCNCLQLNLFVLSAFISCTDLLFFLFLSHRSSTSCITPSLFSLSLFLAYMRAHTLSLFHTHVHTQTQPATPHAITNRNQCQQRFALKVSNWVYSLQTLSHSRHFAHVRTVRNILLKIRDRNCNKNLFIGPSSKDVCLIVVAS